MIEKNCIFMHIPKTAGSSFMAALKDIYQERLLWLTPSTGPLPDLSNLQNYRAFSGHVLITHEIFKKLEDAVSITILRDPVERVIDGYNYLMECKVHPFHSEVINTPIAKAFQNPNWGMSNLMTRYLSGLPNGQGLELAKENLQKFNLFGFMEQYPEFISECNSLMGWNAQVQWINVGSYKPEYGPDIRELITKNNLLDIELFNFAKKLHFKDHSQYGEAKLLIEYFAKHPPKHKFLVDVGAFGIVLSNSFNLLQDHAWSGILIEAMPQEEYFAPLVAAFQDNPRVTIVEGIAIGDYEGVGTAIFNKVPGQRSLLQELEHDGKREIQVVPLAHLLHEHRVPYDFDLLSVDAEGFDERILKCLLSQSDYRPKVIVFEKDAHFKIQPPQEQNALFLEAMGYRKIFETEGNLAYGQGSMETIHG